MENPESNSNVKLTSFSQEEATPNIPTNSVSDNISNKTENIANKDIVTRPLLWGIVVFLVFFGLVIGAVSVYRMYQTEDMVGDDVIDISEPPIATPDKLEVIPVSDNTNVEADLIESEIQSIGSDLEEDIYSDESLGL